MNRTRAAIIVLTAAVSTSAGWSDTAHGDPILRTAVVGRAVQPGEVVRLEVACACGAASAVATANAFDRSVPLVPVRDAGTWQALIGIDVDTRPGMYPVSIAIARPGEAPLTTTHELRVSAKQFQTRRLRVSDSFVNPPQEVLERILRETDRLQALFETVTPHRWDGVFLAPVREPARRNFGARSVFNGQARSPHAGVDFASRLGTPVVAPGAGTVALAEDLFFTGTTVIIDHGLGLYSLLAHLSTCAVTAGDSIHSGQIVGSVGATGRATGPTCIDPCVSTPHESIPCRFWRPWVWVQRNDWDCKCWTT